MNYSNVLLSMNVPICEQVHVEVVAIQGAHYEIEDVLTMNLSRAV